MTRPQITVLGVGNILFSDEGVGVRVVEQLEREYCFPEHVVVVDGGVLGVHLMGVIAQADHLIVVDAVRNDGRPGDLYRLSGDQIPQRIRAKNSLHQVDMLEALTLCAVIDRSPQTVILGVEPADITTLGLELTAAVAARVKDLMGMVVDELRRLGVDCAPRPPQIADSVGGAR
jgi:hydrogenase maturation protease